jgi:hypothetical protein
VIRIAVFVVLGVLAIPLVWSRTNDVCAAFELAAADVPAGQGIIGLPRDARWQLPGTMQEVVRSRGLGGERTAAAVYPMLPSFAACALLFWQARASLLPWPG